MHNFLKILGKPDNVPIAAMVPLFILALAWALWRSRKRKTGQAAEPSDKVHTWPYLARVEFIAAIIVMVILTIWSLAIDAPLEGPANPMVTPNPAKAPWYFLGLQELLVYFDPWIAGVIIPGIIVFGLASIPYIDVNEKGSGYYGLGERPFAAACFVFAFFTLGIGLIVLGVFFRGPGWNFFWPWEYWDHLKVSAITNVNLPEAMGVIDPFWKFMVGAVFELGWYSMGPLSYLLVRKRETVMKLGWFRYFVVSFFVLAMLAIPLKILLRLFNIKYVWVTPWFNY